MINKNIKPHLALALSAIVFMLASCATSDTAWSPPPGGLITSKSAAISFSRLIWQSLNPDLKMQPDSEWQSDMVAYRKNNVWHVREKVSGSTLGGGLAIDISAVDGRVLSVMVIQ